MHLPRGGLPVDDLARRLIDHERDRSVEELEIEAQLAAQGSPIVRAEHVIEALQRMGRRFRPDWVSRTLLFLGAGCFGWAGEGLYEAYLDDNPDKMLAYVILGVAGAILGFFGLLKHRL